MGESVVRNDQLQESRQPEMLNLIITFFTLAILFVLARFWSRRYRKAPIGADDYMMIVALIFTLGTFITAVIEVSLGNGLHTAVVPSGNAEPFFKEVFAISPIYASAITSIKISILLFYRRLFDVPIFKLITNIIGCIVIAWGIAVILVGVFSCHPIYGIWDTSAPSVCVNAAYYYIGVAVPNIITDITILVLPVRMVWQLQTTLGQKIALSITFLTGSLAILVSLYRIVKLFVINDADPFWTLTDATIWTSVEPSVGIVCACLPTLRPLLQLFLPWQGFSKYASKYVRHSARHRYRTDPDSGDLKSHSIKLSSQDRWKSNSLRLYEQTCISRTTEITSTKLEPDPERDEMLLAGISVIHDVDIERTAF